jgi:hypothetical protein
MAILGYNKFNLAKLLETRGLAGWLEIATYNLEAPAKQRIAHEIGTHYAEAVDAHKAAGETEFSAQSKALSDLGDPRVAAVNFQKSYLTGFEATWLKAWETKAAKPLFSYSMLVWDMMPLAALALLYPHPQWTANFRSLAMLVMMAYAVFRLLPRLLCGMTLPRINFLRALALSSSVAGVAVGFAFASFSYTHRDNHGFFGFFSTFNATFLFYFWGFSVNPGFRIWNKLRKTAVTAESWPGKSPEKIVSS